jgi:exopolyphosphatase / guanosine-5'-triphosphate,3'-diphosphate pyrophosphatase
LSVYYRHVGLIDEELSPHVRELATTRLLDRARVLGAAMRVAYVTSAAMPGVLPHTPMIVERGRLKLTLTGRFAAYDGERVFARLRQLARLIGREAIIAIA